MANTITGDTWIVDTPSATAISTNFLDIRGIRWIGGSTSGHAAIIQDQNGKVFWHALAQGANQDFNDQFPERWGRQINGLIVPTLDSGTLYISLATRA